MLWLEHFGLDEQRDKIQLKSSAIKVFRCKPSKTAPSDAAVLDGVFSRRLKQKASTSSANIPN